MKRFCVFGNPIAHSLSPNIHQMFAEQLNHRMLYERQLSSPYRFEKSVAREFARGLHGANVTVPFKVRAAKLCTTLTAAARKSHAVNTLVPLPAGGLLGANTDGFGLVHDLRRQQVDLAGRRILLVGAGGAARGVLQDVIEQQPEVVWIANRTVSKAHQLANAFAKTAAVTQWQQIAGVDVIVNATSASLTGHVPDLPDSVYASAQVIYDMVYGATETSFLRLASVKSDALLSDGLGMLVGQAAESYRLWWNCQQPQITPVVQKLRQQLV